MRLTRRWRKAFRSAVDTGVNAYAFNCLVSLREIKLDRQLEIVPFKAIAGSQGQGL